MLHPNCLRSSGFRALRRLFLVLSLLIFMISSRAAGQSIPINGQLQGEPIISTSTGGANSWVCATPTHVFTISHDQLVYLPFEVRNWTGEFTAPEGTTIVDIFDKRPNSKTNSSAGILILLNNGDLYKLTELRNPDGSRIYINSALAGHIGTAGSESWDKVKGDALYALSSSYLYVSRDSAHAVWAVDTAGLPSQFGQPERVWSFDLDSEQNVYAATDAGLFMQTPTGNTWTLVTSLTGPGSNNLRQVFIDRRNRIIVGNGSAKGIFISYDHGSSWRNDATVTNISGAADDVFGNDYIYGTDSPVQGNLVLLKSSDGLQTWQHIETGLTSQTGTLVNVSSISGDSTLLAGTSCGIYGSTDHGATWIAANNGIGAETFHGFARTGAGRFMASTGLGVFSIKPGDTVWSKVYPSQFSSQTSLTQDGIGNAYVLDYANPGLQHATVPLVVSNNGGASWLTTDTTGMPPLAASVFYVDELGNQHLAASSYGSSFRNTVFVKQHGGTWTGDTMGYTPKTQSFATCMSDDMHGSLYISGYGFPGSVVRRPMAGGAWVADTIGLAGVSYFRKMTAGHDGSMIGSTGSKLYRRSAGNWQKILTPTAIPFANVVTMSVDSNNVLFVAFSTTGSGSGIYFTLDAGASWKYAGFDGMRVSGLYSYGDTTYATTTDGIFALVAKPGVALLAPGVTSVDFGSVAVGASRDTVILISNSGAIADSLTNMASDKPVFSVVSPPSVIPAFSSMPLLLHFAPTSAGKVTGSLTITSNAESSPDHVALSGSGGGSGVHPGDAGYSATLGLPYPNPVSEGVTIPLNVDGEEHISLKLFDMLGSEIVTVYDGPIATGAHEIKFDMQKVTSGYYYLLLKEGSNTFNVPLVVRK